MCIRKCKKQEIVNKYERQVMPGDASQNKHILYKSKYKKWDRCVK